jgi:tetratricopeptide (TPR) repeat protein
VTGLAARHDQPALLEREDELAALERLIALAPSGGRLALVEGPPGIGKTRLLAEGRQRAREAGLEVLSARAIELEQELSYGVVRQLFEPMLAALPAAERDGLLSGPASPAAAVLDPTRPLEEPSGGNPDASFSTLHALYWITASVAARRPLLLSIDDLHCCDLPSLRWLAYLLPRMQDLPVVVVAGMRPLRKDAHCPVLGHVAADPVTTVIQPAPLSMDASTAVVREVLSDADPAFCAACHVESRGNPLWLREMARAVAAEGLEPSAGNVARLQMLGAQAVRRTVSLRLAQLPGHARAVARAVAVLGDGADLGVTAALAELSEDEAFRALLALVAADMLSAGPPLAFVHPVVRAAVESEASPPERDRAHRRAADLLAEAGAEPERVAAHLLKTRPAREAGVTVVLRDAARAALARGAAESSVAYLARALLEPPQEADRAGVLIELGLAESLVSGPAAADHLAQALEALHDPVQRAEVALMLGRTLYFLSRTDDAIAVYRRALAELPAGDSPLQRLLEAAVSHASFTRDGCTAASAAHEYAARHEDRPIDLGGRWLHAVMAYWDAHAGADAHDAADRAERALSGGVFVDEDNGGGGLAVAALVVMHADRDMLPILDTSLARAHARGSVFAFAAAKVFRARAYFLRGELDDAEADARDALDACEEWNIGIGPPYAAAYLADALLEQGRLDDAAKALARGAGPGASPDFVHPHWLLESRARLRILRGDLRGGVAELLDAGSELEARGMYNPTFMPWRSLASLALLALGERDEALELATAELERSRRWGAPRSLAISLRAVGLAEGGARGLERLEEAVAVVAHSPARLEHAKALVELGAALRRANRRVDARELLRRGLELAAQCGAKPLTERAETELLASGARLRRLPGTGVDALTPSERRVAELAAESEQPRDRPVAVRDDQDGRAAPQQRLPQAEHRFTGPACGRARAGMNQTGIRRPIAHALAIEVSGGSLSRPCARSSAPSRRAG